jgi:aminoglycoside phosphotransferase (APT) family kinase protein
MAGMDWNGTPMMPLAGGYSGETFLVGEPGDEVVLRVYERQPDRAVVDASLLRLLDGIVPVPRVVEVRRSDAGRPGVLVTERLPGERLDLLMPHAEPDVLARIGHHVGHVLAALSGVPMPRFGELVGADLAVSEGGLPADDLTAWAWHFRDEGRLASWPDAEWKGLLDLAAEADDHLAGDHLAGDHLAGDHLAGDHLAGDQRGTEAGVEADAEPGAAYTRRVLVHSDFNPKNLLVDPESWQVTGLLDWEFAHAGSPYADLGNLTRFERHPAFVDAVLEVLADRAPVLARDPLRMGRYADLWALVELAGSLRINAVRRLAEDLLRAQARAGDILAWPWETPRRDP